MRAVVAATLLCLLPGTGFAADPAVRTITLVRHGHYEADPEADPKLGPGLTALGVAQARLAAARLVAESPKYDKIFVSPLTRAQDTAKLINEAFPGQALVNVPELAECTPPTRQKAVTASMPQADLDACKAQLDKLFAERFVAAEGAESRQLMVAHGNVIRYLITKSLGVDTERWLEMSVGHVSLTRVRIEADGSIKLIGTGDVGHVPVNLRTGAAGEPERNLKRP